MAAKVYKAAATENSVAIRISGITQEAYYIRFYIADPPTEEELEDPEYEGPTFSFVDYIITDGSLNDEYFVFTGLNDDTEYVFKAAFFDNNQTNLQDMNQKTFSTWHSRPNDWKWTTKTDPGTEVRITEVEITDEAGNVIETKSYLTPLLASEWNGFVDRIYDFYSYYEADNFATRDYRVTQFEPMLAEQANAVLELLNVNNPPVDKSLLPAPTKKHLQITHKFVDGLKEALNSIEKRIKITNGENLPDEILQQLKNELS